MKDVYDILRRWKKLQRGTDRQSDSRFALATLIHAEGSSYRRPGARLLIGHDRTTVGSLSAGCLEEEVILRARGVLETGEPAVMSFDTRRRFGCAGQIDIFIERISKTFLNDLATALAARRSCWAITTCNGTAVGEAASFPSEHDIAPENPDANSVPYNPDPLFVQEIHPPLRLVIVGDGPDNAPLRSLGDALGWEIIETADTNTLSMEPDNWTGAIVKSHNYGRDFSALQKLLPLNLTYVGLIGPRRRRDQLVNHLLDEGVTINAGFFAPAGLDLGAETPEEIALAIAAEIQRVFHSGSGESLRERKVPIHDASRPATADVALPIEPLQT